MRLKGSRGGWRPEWWIPATYLAVSGAWIYGSDALVAVVAGSIERARIISTWKGLGFVLVTGMKEYVQEVAALPEGADFHSVLVKPYEPPQLIEAVARAARFASMRRAVDAATAASGRLKKST